MRLLLLAPILFAGCSALHHKPAPKLTQVDPKPFLVISNRPWINFGNNSVIIRVTDPEWTVLTNAYRTNLSTEPIQFVR